MALTAGTVLELDEKEYRFGVGRLRLRYEKTLHAVQLGDGPWVYVRGVEVRADGKDGDRRDVLVPRSVLRR